MNYYEKRLSQLDKDTLPIQIFGSGDTSIKNDDLLKKIKIGDKVFTTAWFLRDIHEMEIVSSAATNGLTVDEISEITDEQGRWHMGEWHSATFKAIWFKECSRPISSKNVLGQMIWKITRNDKVIYQSK